MSATTGGPSSDKNLTAELRLRPERPPVTRLSRKVLLALAGVSSAAILGASFWALQGRGKGGPGPELYDTNAKTRADGLSTLPHDYTGLKPTIPKLGPPLAARQSG